jgi:hypothetical protein
MNLNPNYPEPPLDPDSPGSPAMPNRPLDVPKGSGHTLPVSNPTPIQDGEPLPEGVIVGPRDPYSETGERLEDPPEEPVVLEEAQEPEELSDAWITLKVKAALAVHPNVSALSTEVTTDHGVVTLSGSAETPYERLEAMSIAEEIKGVKRVNNLLQVNTLT